MVNKILISWKLVGRVWGHSEHLFGLGYAQQILPSCCEGNIRMVIG